MNILTFDTSLDKTYVTLSCDGEILSSEVIENHNEKYHSAFLIPAIVSALKSNNLTMQDIDVLGTNIGPGSFTGIRACVTTARVIAQQLEAPLVGVSSLEILSKINKKTQRTITVLDARKNQFYTAVYENGKEIQAPKLTDAQNVLKLDFSNASVISDKASFDFLNDNNISSYVYTDAKVDLGIFLNELAAEKIQNASKDEFTWGKLKPLYLQSPPITVSCKAKVN